MGVQTMGSHGHGSGQHPHFQPLTRQNSWFTLTLDEVENQLGHLGKPLGSMNLDELLKNVWTAEANQVSGLDIGNTSSASPLQHQASISLARAFSGKTVDEVWRDIQQGQKMKNMKELNSQERESTLGETTLEDFLVKAGLFVSDASLGLMGLDNALTTQNFTSVGLSTSPSIDALSDTPMSGRKRDTIDIDKTLERRLRRKIKNRESAARSRARKQAYHNELVGKVSCLEEENLKLKKEKAMMDLMQEEFDETVPSQMPSEPRYQLRRTSSF